MLPLILKGRLFATDPVKNDTRYADYMSSEVFSIIYIYLPRDYFNGGSKHHKDMVQFINSGQLMSEKLINYSACLSHFTDDLFTRQLCSSYVIHLTNMARYYSDDRYNKTGEKVKVQIRDIKTGYAQQLYTVNVTKRNRPYLELSNHIAEFNKWKLLYLRRDE
jgi:hypothetical protein